MPLVDADSAWSGKIDQTNIQKFRVVPASPSYFTARPRYTDDLLHLQTVLRKYQTLPVCKPGEAPRRAWPVLDQYRTMVGGEQVQATRFARMVDVLRRLNYIHPQVMPDEVEQTLQKFSKKIDLSANRPKPILIDEFGRAKAVGRRKSSSAQVWLVEGDGGVLVNGKTIAKAFPRVHDRESVVWALKATDRLNKYNVWALASGGGTTGQAEAITLGVGKALLAHEPDLKTQLRRGRFVLKSNSDVNLLDASLLIDAPMCSWMRGPRPATCGTEEARKSQGAQDADLGQAITTFDPSGIGVTENVLCCMAFYPPLLRSKKLRNTFTEWSTTGMEGLGRRARGMTITV